MDDQPPPPPASTASLTPPMAGAATPGTSPLARPYAASTAPTATSTSTSAPSPRPAQARPRPATSRRRSAATGDRSCIVCHRRKVKCDKTMPCANCTRSGVLCCYPSTKKAPRQPKTTIADIASRLVQLERTIVAIAGTEAGADGTADDRGDDDEQLGAASASAARAGEQRALSSRPAPPQPQPPAHRSAHGTPQPSVADDNGLYPADYGRDDTYSEGATAAEEILLKNAYASRYINEVLLSRVLEEEQEFRSALTSPKESEDDDAFSDASYAGEPAITLFGTLTTKVQPMSTRSLHPSKAHAIQLWQKYIQTVEPVNKVLHVPTDEIEVFTAIDNPDRIDPAFESLLFSIYFATVTVYKPEQYRATFGENKAIAGSRYRAGMERALVQARFLESPSLRTLQALSLFLRSCRAHSPGRSIWIMYGMVLRSAQAIGLHRDGANFNLSPFESEMRRRLWAHIIGQDTRAAEDHGIDIGLADAGSDTRLALNVNDTDIHPGMTSLPPAQLRWTEMTMNVCMQRLGATADYMTRLIHAMKVQAAAAAASPPSGLPPPAFLTEERRSAIMAQRNSYVNELLDQCSLVVPVQRATYKIVRLIQRKLDFVNRIQLATLLVRYSSTDGTLRDDSSAPMEIATEENLRLACEVIELHVDMMKDEKIQDFQWSAEMFPQYHALLYTLWHMCVRPVTSENAALRDRVWAAADGLFAMEASRQQRQSVKGGNAKWAVLAVLREKALRLRNETQRGSAGSGTRAKTEFPPRGGAADEPLGTEYGHAADIAMADGGGGGSGAILSADVAGANASGAVPNNVYGPLDTGSGPSAAGSNTIVQQRLPLPTTIYSNPTNAAASAAFPLSSNRTYPIMGSDASSLLPAGAPAASPTVASGAAPSPLYSNQDPVPDAAMIEFLGDTSLGMGMDVDWVRDFMGWNTSADDGRWRGTYDSIGQ